ncbi:hypothetical protein TCAL_11842 [Tigriopus californicus]|uniref:Uncharacterized protein n=1 Tax=Tigriopus californicus TaxID=6832 RepID=A0A553NEG0_TIGCA|nr:hypothetical protein TCAL_11842 [Tigriopus californicus]
MRTYKLVILLACAASCLAEVDLNGKWVEDSGKRSNLNAFLSAAGVNFFTRTAISVVSFKNEQLISQDANRYTIDGKKGPRSDPYFYTLVADGDTNTVVDMGILGGPMDTISFVKGNALETRVPTPWFTLLNTWVLERKLPRSTIK